MGDKIFLKAKEARLQADTSMCLQNRVYKLINESSRENICTLEYNIENMSEKAITELKTKLIKDGYEVKSLVFCDSETGEETKLDSVLVITW